MEKILRFDREHAQQKGNPALRILVVEDEPDTATSLAMLLQLYGYDVEVAPDGPTALQRIQVSQPDVVLLDIGLPGMDGWETAEQIREQGNQKPPFVIAITGYGTMADQLHSWKLGIDLHLVKPVDPEFLRKVLARFQTLITPAAVGPGKQQDQQAQADALGEGPRTFAANTHAGSGACKGHRRGVERAPAFSPTIVGSFVACCESLILSAMRGLESVRQLARRARRTSAASPPR